MLKNPWFISTIIYLVFFFWYTNTSGPLSQAEIDLVIERIDKDEQILKNADAVLQEHDLNLVRSAVTLTVSGELDEPVYDDLEEENLDEDTETYELLVNFNVFDAEYGLYIPLDPFFIVGQLENNAALLIEDEEFDRIQPLIEAELEKSIS